MARSHTLSSRATRRMRAHLDAQPDTQDAAAEAAASAPRTSEGPAPSWAPEAPPSDPSPTAHTPREPPGSSPSHRSFHPLRWADQAHARAWFEATSAAVADLCAVAREGSRRLKHRVLSRAELRRQRRGAEIKLLGLLSAAEAGLGYAALETPETPETPEKGEEGE
jgi:hypothetical protein